MPRTFAYLRVSTAGQTTDNQPHEIEAAGFRAEPRRVVAETISGSVATSRRPRPGFARLLDRLETGDVRAGGHQARPPPRPQRHGRRRHRGQARRDRAQRRRFDFGLGLGSASASQAPLQRRAACLAKLVC